MVLDKTVVTKIREPDGVEEWLIERNFACRPFHRKDGTEIEQPLKRDPNVKVVPGLCYYPDGKPIVTPEGWPVLMPRKLKLPGKLTMAEVLDRVEKMKEKEESCPACDRFREAMKLYGNQGANGNGHLPLRQPPQQPAPAPPLAVAPMREAPAPANGGARPAPQPTAQPETPPLAEAPPPKPKRARKPRKPKQPKEEAIDWEKLMEPQPIFPSLAQFRLGLKNR